VHSLTAELAIILKSNSQGKLLMNYSWQNPAHKGPDHVYLAYQDITESKSFA